MIYAISDLHLDYTGNKSMDVFGENWVDYENRIFTNWQNTVHSEDIVLVPGDISWQMSLDHARIDLEKIEELPGTKLILRGNHDYWWSSLKKIKEAGFKTIEVVQNSSFAYADWSIAGTRGWMDPTSTGFLDEDLKVWQRELLRLRMSLDTCVKDRRIVMLHYPPFNKQGEPNEFAEIMSEYGVEICVYGHLHGEGLYSVVEGVYDSIQYHCISSDYLQFIPKKIGE